MTTTKTCEQCDKEYESSAHNSKYCSIRCKRDRELKRSKAQTKSLQTDGELWPTVKKAAPVVVKVPKASAKKNNFKVSLIIPDPQFGYRRIKGELDPFHDEGALQIARGIAEYLRPDESIFLGDVLDLAPFGKYKQEPGFVDTVQPAIDRTYKELAIYASLSDKVVFIQGNHDKRLRDFIELNATAASSIRVAEKDGESGEPVFSVQNLLRFKELGIEHIDSYPMGYYWINKDLACIHGHVVRAAGKTASTVVQQNSHSTIFGHVHRIETAHYTQHSPDGPIQRLAHTPGCLARVDNSVPGVHTSLDSEGRPTEYFQNWQQGVSVVYSNDEEFWLQNVPFKSGRAFFDGKIFE